MKFANWIACAATAAFLLACGGSDAPEPAASTPPPAAENPAPATPPAAETPTAGSEGQAPLTTARDFPRPAQELSFRAMDGRQVSLSDLEGKAVLVMYFSTDCPHCQRTAEVLAPVYADLKSKGVEVLGLAMNPAAQQNLKAFVDKYQVEFPVSTASRQDFARFSGLSMMERFYYPYLLFVDPEGNLVEEHQGSDSRFFSDLDRSLRETFKKLLDS